MPEKILRTGAAQAFKGTIAWQGVYRRTLTTIGVIAGALVTIHGMAPDTTWQEFGTLMTPMVALGVIIQIASGLLSQAPEDK